MNALSASPINTPPWWTDAGVSCEDPTVGLPARAVRVAWRAAMEMPHEMFYKMYARTWRYGEYGWLGDRSYLSPSITVISEGAGNACSEAPNTPVSTAPWPPSSPPQLPPPLIQRSWSVPRTCLSWACECAAKWPNEHSGLKASLPPLWGAAPQCKPPFDQTYRGTLRDPMTRLTTRKTSPPPLHTHLKAPPKIKSR